MTQADGQGESDGEQWEPRLNKRPHLMDLSIRPADATCRRAERLHATQRLNDRETLNVRHLAWQPLPLPLVVYPVRRMSVALSRLFRMMKAPAPVPPTPAGAFFACCSSTFLVPQHAGWAKALLRGCVDPIGTCPRVSCFAQTPAHSRVYGCLRKSSWLRSPSLCRYAWRRLGVRWSSSAAP
jgi:hypothetical protein